METNPQAVDRLRLIRVDVQDIKAIKAVSIDTDRSVVEISGKNGQGKSSILDSIWWALAGTRPIQADPVRHGAEKGEVELDLGDMIVRRVIPKVGSPKLVVEMKNGLQPGRPQELLDSLIGPLNFDPLEFARADAKRQIEMLRGLVKDFDFEAAEAEHQGLYDQRRDFNRDVKSLEARIANAPDFSALKDVPDIDDLEEEYEFARRQNEARKDLESARIRLDDGIASIEKRVKELQAEAARMKSERAALAEPPEEVDLAPLREKLTAARAAREEAASLKGRKEAYDRDCEDLKALRKKVDQANDRMDEIKASITKAIADADLGLEGFEIAEGAVLLNGVPFDQASTAQKIRASAALAMAGDSKIRLLWVREGSLLDEDSLKALREMAEERDFQVLLETVGEGHEGAVIIEDGQVRE